MANFKFGDVVIATPKDNDFNNEFEGTIISNNNNFFQVEDGDGDVFDCEECQLAHSETDDTPTRTRITTAMELIPNSDFIFNAKEDYDFIWIEIGNVTVRIDVTSKYTNVEFYAKGNEEGDPIKSMSVDHQEIQDVIDSIENHSIELDESNPF